MSYVFRKVKKYTINLLEVFAFNRFYSGISTIVLVLTWFDLFGVVASGLINSLIILTWISGWWYEIHKLTKENELLRSVNASLTNYEAEDVREDLAALMHDIWAEDVFKTDLSLDEQYRTNIHYVDLSYEDKQVNLTKADKVFEVINRYKKDNNV